MHSSFPQSSLQRDAARSVPLPPRADRVVEQQLGLHFRPLPPSTLQQLQHRLRALADTLRQPAPTLTAPEHGVLSQPLSESQRLHLDEHLSASYAQMIRRFEQPRETMRIVECGEPMVSLRAVLGEKVTYSDRPFVAACGSYAGKERIYWVRRELAERLKTLVGALAAIGVGVHLEDGFRPLEVQQGLYRRRLELIRSEHPDWDEDAVRLEAAAKTASAPYRAAHMSGAAVDLRLFDRQSGELLPLGNDYPVGGVATYLDFPYVTAEEWATRQLFGWSARLVGLVPYRGEDWHLSCGDGLANLESGAQEIRYGPLADFDRRNGEVQPLASHLQRLPFSE